MAAIINLTQFVQHNGDLLYKIWKRIPYVENFSLQPGCVGDTVALSTLIQKNTLGNGYSCTPSDGTSTFSERAMKVGHYRIDNVYCERQLLPYLEGLNVKIGEPQDDGAALAEAFVNSTLDDLTKDLRRMIWQGVYAVDRMDGIATIVTADGTNVSSISLTNYAIIGDMISKAMQDGLEDFVVHVPADKYFDVIQALLAVSGYHYIATPEEVKEQFFTYPGTNIKVRAERGLNLSATAILAEDKNIVYGFGEKDDAESLKWKHNEITDEYVLAGKFNAGIQVAFPAETYYNALL